MPVPHFDEDHDLVEKCKAGCHDSFTELVNKYYQVIYSRACSCLNDEEEARDLTQDIFIDIFKAIPSFRGDSLFFSWMYQITTFKCKARLNYLIRRGYADSTKKVYDENEGESVNENHSFDPEEAVFRTELGLILNRCLDRLQVVDRKILMMKDAGGYTRLEIAEQLGITEGSVRNRLASARYLMKSYVDESVDISEILDMD